MTARGKPKRDPIAAIVREMEWEHPFLGELLARLFEGEPPHDVLPSAGTSGMRLIGMLVKLCRHFAQGGGNR